MHSELWSTVEPMKPVPAMDRGPGPRCSSVRPIARGTTYAVIRRNASFLGALEALGWPPGSRWCAIASNMPHVRCEHHGRVLMCPLGFLHAKEGGGGR